MTLLNKVKQILGNEKGNVGLNLVMMIFILMVIYMMLGGAENNIAVMTVNEIKDILETSAPYAIREGINESAHKNETLLYKYDEEPITIPGDPNKYTVKSLFIKKVLDALDTSTFKSRIVYDRAVLKNKLETYTRIEKGSGKWVNSWSKVDEADERKDIDFVILSTVMPVEIKSTILTSDIKKIEDEFNTTGIDGNINEGDMKVSLNLTENGIGAFIRFEMRVILK